MSMEKITKAQQDIINKFTRERLSHNEVNKILVSKFRNATAQGKSLVSYLQHNGQNEDVACKNAYYLIKDGDGDVALFFFIKVRNFIYPI